MQNELITKQDLVKIEGEEVTVTFDSIVRYSGLTKNAVRKHIRKKVEILIKNGLRCSDLAVNLNYSKMKFNEKSATLLMTYLPSSEKVDLFKEKLVNDFFNAREIIKKLLEEKNKKEIHQLDLITKQLTDTLIREREEHKKEIELLKLEIEKAKRDGMNFAEDGSTSVTNIKKLLNIDNLKVPEINDALVWKGFLITVPKITIKRDVAPNLDGYIGHGKRKHGSPYFQPEAVLEVVREYERAGSPEVTIDINFTNILEKKLKHYKKLIKNKRKPKCKMN